MPYFKKVNWTDKDIIFVHIPKTGGSYITKQLEERTENVLNIKSGHHKIKQHYSLVEIRSYNEIRIADTYIFTLVRNPITKIVSTYNFFKNCKVKFPSIDLYLDFVEDTVTNKAYLDSSYLTDYFKENAIDLNHFRPQNEFVQSDDVEVHYFKIEDELEKFVAEMWYEFSIDMSKLYFRKNHFNQLDNSQKNRIMNLYLVDYQVFGF